MDTNPQVKPGPGADPLAGSMSFADQYYASQGNLANPMSPAAYKASLPTGPAAPIGQTGPAAPVEPPPSTTPTSATSLADVMTSIQAKVTSNNTLMNQRNLVLTALYDRPLNEQERQQLPKDILKAIDSGDRTTIDMNLRLINDEIRGKTNTLDSAVKYLTDAYQADITAAETKKQNHIESLTKAITALTSASMEVPPSMVNALTAALGVEGAQSVITGAQQSVDTVSNIASAIGQYESGGKYDAVGPATKTGDRAYGKYQIMGANIPKWTEKALGTAMGVDEFLKDPSAQDATAQYMMNKYYSATGNIRDVASMWFTGRTEAEAGADVSDVTGTKNKQYIDAVEKFYNQSTSAGAVDLYQYPNLSDTAKKKASNLYPEELTFLNELPKKGQEKWFTIPEQWRSDVQMLIQGEEVSTLATSMGASMKTKLQSWAKQVDPTYSPAENMRRNAYKKKWMDPTTATGKSRVAANTALSHLSEYSTNVNALKNVKFAPYNKIANEWKKQLGMGNYQTSENNITTAQNPGYYSTAEWDRITLANELAAAYKGGTAPTDQETEKFYNGLNPNLAPAMFKATIQETITLLSRRLGAQAADYRAQTKSPLDPSRVLYDLTISDLTNAGIDVTPLTVALSGESAKTNLPSVLPSATAQLDAILKGMQ